MRSRSRLYAAALLAAALLAGCGQKGPLYLRDSPPPGVKPPKPAPYKAPPYGADERAPERVPGAR